ncbi:MAG: two-component regulator propeller domain-containing protein [Acidobacteriota bacterium]
MVFEGLDGAAGAPLGGVSVVFQDRTGFLWLGTPRGLSRWDGYAFIDVRSKPGESIPQGCGGVLALVEDQGGDLWVGTDAGLCRWRRNRDVLQPVPLGNAPAVRSRAEGADAPESDTATDSGASEVAVGALAVDRGGRVWVGTAGTGLHSYAPSGRAWGVHRHSGDPGSLPSDHVHALHVDRLGVLWIGTEGGLSAYDATRGTFRTLRHDPDIPGSLPHDRVFSMVQDHRGALWVGTEGGLARIDVGAMGFRREAPVSADGVGVVRTLFEDGSGRLWAGSDRGLFQIDGSGAWRRYGHDPADPGSLPAGDVHHIVQDRGGLLWVATAGGAARWNPRRWELRGGSAALGAGARIESGVTAFATAAGDVWLGTASEGVLRVPGDSKGLPSTPGPLADRQIRALAWDRDGLWVGTDAGLDQLDPGSGRLDPYRHDPGRRGSLPASRVTALEMDAAGRLWVGTDGGGVALRRWDPTGRSVDFQSFGREEGLPGTRVSSLSWGDSGLWVGTEVGLGRISSSGGTFEVDGGTPDGSGLPVGVVTALHQDVGGSLWAAFHSLGLYQLARPGSGTPGLRRWDLSEALGDAEISGIEGGDDGDLWLVFPRGLCRLRVGSGTVQIFGPRDGLAPGPFLPGSHHRSEDGKLFFGHAGGFESFLPSAVGGRVEGPNVVWTGFFEDGQRRSAERPTSLVEGVFFDEGVTIGLEMAALDFADPRANRYAFRLEGPGLTPEWTAMGEGRRLTFGHLPKGRYDLEVRVRGADGVPGVVGRRLAIEVGNRGWAWSGHPWLGLFGLALALGALAWIGAWRRGRGTEVEVPPAAGPEAENAPPVDPVSPVLEPPATETPGEQDSSRTAPPLTSRQGRFLAKLSHQIRNPMSGVLGMASMLSQTPLDERQTLFLESIRSSGRSVLAILDDLRELARSVGGPPPIGEIDEFDLRSTVASATAEAEELISDLDVELRWLDTGPLRVRGEGASVRRIVVELLRVAGGLSSNRRVRCDMRLESVEDARTWVLLGTLRVDDLGDPELEAEKLFEPFFPIFGGGTGLGAAVSRRLCERFGGGAWASRVGERAVEVQFELCLLASLVGEAAIPPAPEVPEPGAGEPPVAEAAVSSSPAPEPPSRAVVPEVARASPRSSARRVLLAEDQPVNQMVASGLLTRLGYRVDIVSDGLAAVDAVKSGSYGIVLMDLQMPRLDGFAATRRIRMEVDSGRQPYIIAMTAHAMRGDRERCLAAGMDQYVSKPIDPADLEQALDRAETTTGSGLRP